MRVIIAGAGNVGRSIATELLDHRHQVILIEKDPNQLETAAVPGAQWLLADACELSALESAGLENCDVAIAATGDDKANLVHALLAKTEFGVPRTVARVNHPTNEWLFTDSWGVDVAVSTPRLMSALVEEAVAVGELVRLFSLGQSHTDLMEMTLPPNSPVLGRRIGAVIWPDGAVLVAVIRNGQPSPADPDLELAGGDELLFVARAEAADQLARLLIAEAELPVGDAATRTAE